MNTNDSLKRNSCELVPEAIEDNSNGSEPPHKQQKTENDADASLLNHNETPTPDAIIIPNSSPGTDTPACSISIRFHDDSVADLYRQKFLNFIKSFVELTVASESKCCIDICRQDVETVLITDEDSPKNKKRKKRSRVKKELFMVDATPSSDADRLDFRYTTKFTISTEKADEGNTPISKQTCFNCEECHSLKDCPYPRDHDKINAARLARASKTSKNYMRYHSEDDQRFSHLVPGKISSALRKALGLKLNEVPSYVYFMRNLGYPPGWLEEAKEPHSKLDLFDINGRNVKVATKKRHVVNPEKIVEYSGFNVPFDTGVKDDFRTWGVPPFSSAFSKEEMLVFLDKHYPEEDDEDDVVICELQDEEVKGTDPKSPSPTLVDLEQQKQEILEILNCESKPENGNSSFSLVKESCFGTPILKSSSPYSALPHPDKFSKDVSPVINFENLPNSTGKYEQMVDVLQKVRTTMKSLSST